MDTEAAALQDALAALHAQLGGELRGPQRSTEARMRQVLQQQLSLDELAADRLVKKLIQTGRLVYVAAGQVPAAPDASGASGALFDIPAGLTPSGEERVVSAGTTAGVEATLGGINTVSGHLGGTLPAVDAGLVGARSQYRDDVGLPTNPGAAGAARAENHEGATMGQVGDTNVEGGPSHAQTVGEAEALKHDDTDGYWRIGA